MLFALTSKTNRTEEEKQETSLVGLLMLIYSFVAYTVLTLFVLLPTIYFDTLTRFSFNCFGATKGKEKKRIDTNPMNGYKLLKRPNTKVRSHRFSCKRKQKVHYIMQLSDTTTIIFICFVEGTLFLVCRWMRKELLSGLKE